MKEKTTIKKLFHKKDCLGWAWECKGKRHYYSWQNDNDLGLCCDIDEATYPETIQRKIKVGKAGYIYVLRNKYGITDDDICMTEPQMIAWIKDCHAMPLTQHDKMLIKHSEANSR